MTADELTGRMLVLEVIAMASLGLYLANSKNDPDMGKARALLDFLRKMIADKAIELKESQRPEALRYSDDLLSQVLENLKALRGNA